MNAENNGEKHIRRGRTLIGVDMGEGFKEYNDPGKAIDYLIENCDRMGGRVKREITKVTSDRSRNYTLRPYLNRALRVDSDVIERFKTAQLELAWLFGRTAVVDELVKGQVEDWTDKIVKGKQNG